MLIFHHVYMGPPTWKLSETCTLGMCVEASSRKYDPLQTQFPAPLPSIEWWVPIYMVGIESIKYIYQSFTELLFMLWESI